MRTYEVRERKEKELVKVVCNACAKEIPLERKEIWTDYFHGEKTWGYFSEKDGKRESFDLCQSCYEKLVKSFRINVD